MSLDAAAAIAANRFGLGAKPGDLDTIGSDPRGWLNAQLSGAPPLLAAPGLKSVTEILGEAFQLRGERREAKQNPSPDKLQAAFKKLPQFYRPIYIAEVQARLRNAVATPRPFAERLVYFWSNHFAVSVDKPIVTGIAGSLERDAIRPHVLGNFYDMVRAVEQHPGMLLYLDNQRSVGPNSVQAQRAAKRDRTLGLNENLAREIMELHTLGVDGGYTQADVTSFAKVLTGWSLGLGDIKDQGVAGAFMFRPLIHEPGAQTVYGHSYRQADVGQGEAVLKDLSTAPATAKHIATKLARHFIADDPPARAVVQISTAFEKSGGDLPATYRAVIACQEAWSNSQSKFKTPQDYVLSVYRGLEIPVAERADSILPFETLGQRQFSPGSPAGYPDRSDDWDGASALMKRIEFADAMAQALSSPPKVSELGPQLLGATYTNETRTSISRAASTSQGLTLLLTSPEFLRR
jgi:uncharacterized protein (DUF1800 family)